jgi:SAM-dependent methyltransferase
MDNRHYFILFLAAMGFFVFCGILTMPIWIPILILNSPWIITLFLLCKYTRLGGHAEKIYLKVYDWLVYQSETPRRLLWQGFYEFMSWYCQDPDWVTMNYGYALLTDDGKMIDDLLTEEQDKRETFSLQLYYFITGTNKAFKSLAGKTLVEVGSGRGGGISFLTRHFKPAKAVGIDFSLNQVEFCKTRHSDVNQLQFHQGDAESFTTIESVGKNSVDCVVNVESSHCYGNIDNFFTQVNEALKQDGVFCFTDFRGSEEMEELHKKVEEHFKVEKSIDITRNVCHALKLDTDRRLQVIEEKCPKVFVPLINKFSGVTGSRVYDELNEGKTLYHAWILKKK